MRRITPCIAFDQCAEQAADLYVSVFPRAHITSIQRYGRGAPLPPGVARSVGFELDGEPFLAINFGVECSTHCSPSLVVHCDTQEEIDHYWERLSAGGTTHHGGWLSDRFGVAWQIVPGVLTLMLADPDQARALRVAEALERMRKVDIATLQRAWDGVRPVRESSLLAAFSTQPAFN
ncbi:MAG TPA: VOC family protein [Xanthomonadaceae bacterium]|nr:VOC family protein [Xanthomonadaceae bacterium]